ncbi:hypothetical protein [Succinimonas sp.]|uniref:hypothetical protein n=1 Tax=Succinimonas sp. TaxID=1936151 RepID=UPI0038688166
MQIQRIFRYRIPLKAPLTQNGFQIRERRGFLLCSPGGDLGEFAPLPGFSPSREEDILRDLLTFQRCRDYGMEIPEGDLRTPEALFAVAMLKFPLNGLPEKPPLCSLFGTPPEIRARRGPLLDNILRDLSSGSGQDSGSPMGIKIKAGIFPLSEELSLIEELLREIFARGLRGRVMINPDGNRSLSPENARRISAALGDSLGWFEDPLPALSACLSLGIPLGLDTLWGEFAACFPGTELPEVLRHYRIKPVIKPALIPGFMSLREIRPVLSSAFESPAGIGWIRRLAARFETDSGTDTLKYFPEEARTIDSFMAVCVREL